ncbi:MAG: nitrilase-related carbon-nitrogen hydrolase [Propionicimonas sp.]
MRIVIVQCPIVPGEVELNLSAALQRLSEALLHRPDVVLYPEEMLVGYPDGADGLAEPIEGGAAVARVREVLRGSSTRAILGLTETDGVRTFITAVVVSADGVEARYRKTHLWAAVEGSRHEPSRYTAGEQLVVFELAGIRCGLVICYDGDFPEMFRAYAGRGCAVVFWLNNRRSRGPRESRHLAVSNSLAIATSCPCGPDENGDHCPGGSHLIDHRGDVIAQLWDEPGLVVGELDPGQALADRLVNPFYQGRRPELYS